MTSQLSATICPSGRTSAGTHTDSEWQIPHGLLAELLSSSLIRRNDWERLDDSVREDLVYEVEENHLLVSLVTHKLLTDYQAERIRSGQKFGLVVGNYRVLAPLGRGSMGQVYKAEHIRLPRFVAIKIQVFTGETDADFLRRFENEAWTIAQLCHTNIVSAIDAGEVIGDASQGERLLYLAMEYVPGKTLEELVVEGGAFSKEIACRIVFQLAGALKEICNKDLIHRDIKPSNVILTPEGASKLLDFGLSRHAESRMTNPGSWLGTVDYLAPEQAQDASSVDIRADIYSLGATLYWCLTGQTPFVSTGRVVEDFLRRMNQSPPSILDLRPDLPPELAAVVARMMAVKPCDRFETPAAVMAALLPFFDKRKNDAENGSGSKTSANLSAASISGMRSRPRVLVVDDEATVRKCVKLSLISEGIDCDEADNGETALKLIDDNVYDLVLTDIEMPVLSGLDFLRDVRNRLGLGNLKVLVFSGRSSPNEMAQMMSAGADDYLVKPLSIVQLRSRVNAALRLKQSQDAAMALNQKLFEANQVMVQSLSSTG